MFSQVGARALKKDLGNTLALLESLGNPHHHINTIHIAGTNGKGSVSHMMAGIFHECGYRTGLYTSPHLTDFRERIRINGTWIDEETVIHLTEKLKPEIERLQPSFFEVTVAMALYYFSRESVQMAVIETGLGGILDSTNVVTPELSIITNIALEHTSILGKTLEKIAGQKAGIIKPGIPALIGHSIPETKPVFLEKAAQTASPIIFADEIYTIHSAVSTPDFLKIALQNNNSGEAFELECDLPGSYQQFNVRTAWAAAQILQNQGWSLASSDVRNALRKIKSITGLRGRWEIMQHEPFVILDVAHNPQGMEMVIAQLQSVAALVHGRKVHMVLGMVKDKDIEEVLNLLPASYQFYFTQVNSPRQFPAEDLARLALERGLDGEIYHEVNEALSAALSNAHTEDVVMVCGSVFLVGEVNRERFEKG